LTIAAHGRSERGPRVDAVEPECEPVPAPRHPLDAQGPHQGLGDPPRHRQSETGPLGADAADPLGPVERFEHVLALVGVEPAAVILDAEQDGASLATDADPHRRPGGAVLHRVVEQVIDELGEQRRVGTHQQRTIIVGLDMEVVGPGVARPSREVVGQPPREVHDLEAAVAGERTARLAVETARAKLNGAVAALEHAKAHRDVAGAAVEVANSRLATARVNLSYASIRAPFDGVVTRRQFHPGAFIRAASDGNQPLLLTVARIDLMRVVVRVPDRDLVLANAGEPAELVIDALEGRTFRGTVARVAESEEHQTRTMRVEIDLPNPDGVLREGMYGRATIRLAAQTAHLTLPAECIQERTGKGTVRVVRDGEVRREAVELGADDGSSVEVVSGLGRDDRVVIRSGVPLEDGMRVEAEDRG
jgi:RND family efflux transporter MFP subunit